MTATQIGSWLAVGPAGDRLAQARALRRVNEAFHAGQDVRGRVRDLIAESWARCGRAGVRPVDQPPSVVLDEREVAERWARSPLKPLLPALREVLCGATSESAHILAITDERGVVLHKEGHDRVMGATRDLDFVVGADWSEPAAGTNAMGTAIAVDHPVHIFSAEHFQVDVHPWHCAGAPIHDPVSGAILGVVDLTGHLRTAHPHTLGLVAAAAGMADAFLRHELARHDDHARTRYLARVQGARQRTALLRPTGHVVEAVPDGWLAGVVGLPAGGEGEVALPDGGVGDVERLAGTDALVLWRRHARVTTRPPPAHARVELMAARPRIVLPERTVDLTLRHAELLAVLLLAGRDLSAEELASELYGSAAKASTLRGEVTRLRRLVGDVLRSRPYGFGVPVTSDLAEAERALADGDPGRARSLARGGLLPRSTVPAVVAARARLEDALRA